MASQALWKKLLAWLKPIQQNPSPQEQARAIIKAVDAGGLPLNAARVNHVARQLGLDVANTAPIEVTIARMRKLLKP